jgi:hypothetical protein
MKQNKYTALAVYLSIIIKKTASIATEQFLVNVASLAQLLQK